MCRCFRGKILLIILAYGESANRVQVSRVSHANSVLICQISQQDTICRSGGLEILFGSQSTVSVEIRPRKEESEVRGTVAGDRLLDMLCYQLTAKLNYFSAA